jgi:Ras-related protein Rab-2A
VFDLTRRATFESATSWLTDLRAIAEDGVVVVLVGNKSDLCDEATGPSKREVPRAEALAWCKANNIFAYIETSAKSGANVEDAFLHVAQKIYEGIEAGRYDLNDRRSGVKAAAGLHGSGRGGVSLRDARVKTSTNGCC